MSVAHQVTTTRTVASEAAWSRVELRWPGGSFQKDKIVEEYFHPYRKLRESYLSGSRTGRTSSQQPNEANVGKSEDIDSILRSALPDMTMVKSSNIYAIGYDAENQMMYVLFSRESPIIYRYQKVSAEDHKAVVEAESVGKEFAARVKNECAHQRLKMIGDGVAVEESSP